MSKIEKHLDITYFPKTYILFIFLGVLALASFMGGYWKLIQYDYFTLPTAYVPEVLKNSAILLFNSATSLGLLAAIIYNILQYNYIQKQNGIQEFEKKFFNRLDYLDKIIIPELKYEHHALDGVVAQKREAFEYFNEHFKVWELDSIDYEKISKTTDLRKLKKMLNPIAKLYDDFYLDNLRGRKTFDFYINSFELIIRMIDANEHLNDIQKYRYITTLLSQLNIHQSFTIAMLIIGGKSFPDLSIRMKKYENILNEFVYYSEFDFDYNGITILPRPNFGGDD